MWFSHVPYMQNIVSIANCSISVNSSKKKLHAPRTEEGLEKTAKKVNMGIES